MAGPVLGATAALQGLSGVLGGVTSLIPTRQSRRNKSEIDKLLRREELGALGLSATEEQDLAAALQRQARASRDASQRAQEVAMGAFGGTGAGAQLARAVAAQEAAAATQSDIAGEVAAVDRQREQEQRQELEDRLAAEAQRQSQALGLLTGGLQNVAELGAEAINLSGLTTGRPNRIYGQAVENLSVEIEDEKVAQLRSIRDEEGIDELFELGDF